MAGATKSAESKELTAPKETNTDLALYEAYEADIGAGYENQTAEDISVPFIEILQSNSPECLTDDGPRPGTIINRATGEVWNSKDGIQLIPVTTQHVVVEWVPREKGGGIVATYQLDDPLVQKVRAEQPMGKYEHPTNGNDLIETFYVYAILVDGVTSYPVVMAFTSTRIKPYKDWMFRARSIVIALPNGRKLTKLPLFSHKYQLTTTGMENNKGKWFSPVIRFAGENAEAARIPPNSELYIMAKQLCEDVNEGKKQADTSTAAGREEPMDNAPKRGDTDSEDVPY